MIDDAISEYMDDEITKLVRHVNYLRDQLKQKAQSRGEPQAIIDGACNSIVNNIQALREFDR